jgi:Family of unknown function (DUF5317)
MTAMFILYAVIVGLAVGLALGGHPSRLGRLHFRWSTAIAGGLLIQVALFSTSLGEEAGDAAPWIYLASTVLVLAAVLRNVAIPGMALVAAGGASNAIAILANGGYMPVSPDALEAMGRAEQAGYSNSRLVEGVVLTPLTDVFSMPVWVPMANVFSIGDILIGVGIAAAIVLTMRRDASDAAPRRPSSIPWLVR